MAKFAECTFYALRGIKARGSAYAKSFLPTSFLWMSFGRSLRGAYSCDIE
jgi:hypothetical protein